MKNKIIVILGAVFVIVVASLGAKFLGVQEDGPNLSVDSIGKSLSGQNKIDEKIYVAVEGEGKIAVIDAKSREVIKKIDLSNNDYGVGGKIVFMPHNVQVASNGDSVWVTGNAMFEKSESSAGRSLLINQAIADEGHGGMISAEQESDAVIVINPESDEIIKRIPLGADLHLAHVVLTPDSSSAIVTSQKKGLVYKINARTFEVEKTMATIAGGEPHGLRIAPDGKIAYIAMLGGKSIGALDLEKFTIEYMPLKGAAVQIGVTADGKYVMASVYDSKSLAVVDLKNKTLSYIDLPKEAKGPVQIYPTPDSKFVYLADQGYYFDQPTSDVVYKIDLNEMKIVKSIKAGKAPHGVVVSSDGKFAYVTNLLSEDVSVIDTSSDVEIAKIKVGSQPNGISVWSREFGGTQ